MKKIIKLLKNFKDLGLALIGMTVLITGVVALCRYTYFIWNLLF